MCRTIFDESLAAMNSFCGGSSQPMQRSVQRLLSIESVLQSLLAVHPKVSVKGWAVFNHVHTNINKDLFTTIVLLVQPRWM